jgi:glycosyltransferase involved in cell wall biosynthesis
LDFEAMTCAIVIIGRNEGERLRRCLRSLPPGRSRVYVDSGSTDGSQDFARSLGIDVVELDPSIGFTAARARNAGLDLIRQAEDVPEFVQMIDGDCELGPDWIGRAVAALATEPGLAAVFGRRRERFPEASLYNQQCDDEWNVPIGLVASCGGDVLFRMAALSEVGDYQAEIIAGEEPDLCLRLSRRGWMIRRIDAEMTLHDANLLHFSQWWKRARRSGHAYAEHLWRNRQSAIPSWRRQVWSILVWGLGIPVLGISFALAGGAFVWVSAALVGLYPLQWLRLALRGRESGRARFGFAALIVVGKFAELGGIARFALSLARGYAPKIIEYKGSA